MAETSSIEWTDATWQIVTGCSVVTPGCTSCYAMRLAGTRLRHHPSRVGLTRETKAGPVWTGEVRFNKAWLLQPLHWKRPRNIFVAAHGDLFHEGVPDAVLDMVFAVMALADWHTMQVLTKRSGRARAYLSDPATPGRIADAAFALRGSTGPGGERRYPPAGWPAWPLPNVWLGVSAEDQRRADERMPDLLATPAAVRFVSAEPLLSGIDFRPWAGWIEPDAVAGERLVMPATRLDWIIVGAESGRQARPMDEAWARDIEAACRAAGVACFVKQLSGPGGRAVKDIKAFPADLRVRQMPAVPTIQAAE